MVNVSNLLKFDLCDKQRHFARVVPQYACSSVVLRNAIFALSAQHLSQISNYDIGASDNYYCECLKELLALTSKQDAIMDEALLVAAVILRLMEELRGMSLRAMILLSLTEHGNRSRQ
jgi:hypothetical protein